MVKNNEKLSQKLNHSRFGLSNVVFLSSAWKNVKRDRCKTVPPQTGVTMVMCNWPVPLHDRQGQ